MKYKLLVINEKNLITELENQARLGYEPVEFLNKQDPNAYSDDRSYKILLVKRK